jgi:hypothetical protein
MAAPRLKVPGLFIVNSKITRPDILSEENFIKWYSESALRFKNADPKADGPFLVLYPMDDVGFTQSDEFRKIGVYSDLLPGGAPVYDLTDMNARIYSFIDKYEPKVSVEPGMLKKLNSAGEWLSIAGQTKLVVSGGFDLGDEINEQDFHDWYNKEVSS